ncbi:MAG: hypothetical protein JSW39_18135 [Desulfobacterales bacterium]|nr:MAG: hypothetical protein JSW39_18135 [Desulfobacterales bacterium]
MRNEKKTSSASILLIAGFAFGFVLLAYHAAISDDLPRFMGIYVKQEGKYVEVPRVIGEVSKYDFRTSAGGRKTDYYVKETIKRDLFVITSLEEFNKSGFFVKEDKDWSDFVLKRVPHTGEYIHNEREQSIITTVAIGDPMSLPCCTQYLEKIVEPFEWCPLEKAQLEEGAYIYAPSRPVEQGFYLIDYKKDGQSFSGWNAIQIR